jgi:hypothetical protein
MSSSPPVATYYSIPRGVLNETNVAPASPSKRVVGMPATPANTPAQANLFPKTISLNGQSQQQQQPQQTQQQQQGNTKQQ